MKNINLGLLIVLFLSGIGVAKADSPLTSTPFHNAYENVKIVNYALVKGRVDKKIAKFLMKKKNSIAIKAAVINAMGWDTEGKKNAEKFLEFLVIKRKISSEDKSFDKLTPQDLFCMGYMMAMDDYHDVVAGEQILRIACEKMPQSFTVAFIHALVESQINMDFGWCKVWEVVYKVEQNKSLVREMSSEAIGIVMEYIDLYKEDC